MLFPAVYFEEDMHKRIFCFLLLFVSAQAVLILWLFPRCAAALDNPEHAGFPEVMEMTLTDAVFLALRYNRSLESAYLDRVMQRFNLRQSLTKFHPNLSVSMDAGSKITDDSTSYKEDGIDGFRETTHQAEIGARASAVQKIPTGAEISFAWGNMARTAHSSYRDSPTQKTRPVDSDWRVNIRQPLLKGGGIDYNTASVVRARLREEEAVRSMRDTVITTVSGVILDYRTLLRAYQDLKVQEASLEKSREQLEVLKALIAAGRRASNELIQSEASLARQELAVEEARSSLNDAQLSLLNKLNIGRDITVVPTEVVEYRHIVPDFEECLEIAFERNAGFHRAVNQIETARLDIVEASNQRLWDLSMDAEYRKGWHQRRVQPYDYTREAWSVGLSLNVPLPIYGDEKYSRESSLLSAEISSRKAEMNLQTIEENLENEVRTAVRRVNSARKQVELARRTREFSEQSFQVSELQFRMGRISNHDYIQEQEKLRNDQLAENNAIIAYENTLTSLDQLLATTLDTWEIEFIPQRADLEEELLGSKTWMLGN